MRLDKYLAQMGVGTRSEVKQVIKKGLVTLNDKVEKSPKSKINPTNDLVAVDGQIIEFIDRIYLMLNKPKNVVSATEDERHQTVIDLITEYAHLDLFPVGRLDKDTEGLLLITNDGQFNHELMSPKKHVPKTYEVKSKNSISKNDIKRFKSGIELHDGMTRPAILEQGKQPNQSFVTIVEGRYHQVKRMFHAIDNEVLQLRRIRIGDLELDADLQPGEYRQLTQKDLQLLNFNKEGV